jgi:hypothetical protein
MSPPDLRVVEFPAATYYDVAATLRRIADAVEAGEYGEIETGAIVLNGENLEVFGMGRYSELPAVHVLLHAAMLSIASGVSD